MQRRMLGMVSCTSRTFCSHREARSAWIAWRRGGVEAWRRGGVCGSANAMPWRRPIQQLSHDAVAQVRKLQRDLGGSQVEVEGKSRWKNIRRQLMSLHRLFTSLHFDNDMSAVFRFSPIAAHLPVTCAATTQPSNQARDVRTLELFTNILTGPCRRSR